MIGAGGSRQYFIVGLVMCTVCCAVPALLVMPTHTHEGTDKNAAAIFAETVIELRRQQCNGAKASVDFLQGPQRPSPRCRAMSLDPAAC